MADHEVIILSYNGSQTSEGWTQQVAEREMGFVHLHEDRFTAMMGDIATVEVGTPAGLQFLSRIYTRQLLARIEYGFSYRENRLETLQSMQDSFIAEFGHDEHGIAVPSERHVSNARRRFEHDQTLYHQARERFYNASTGPGAFDVPTSIDIGLLGRPLLRGAVKSLVHGHLNFANDNTAAGVQLVAEACTICLDDYTAADEVVQMPCKHYMHKECFIQMLTSASIERGRCPECRADIFLDDVGEKVRQERLAIHLLGRLIKAYEDFNNPHNSPVLAAAAEAADSLPDEGASGSGSQVISPARLLDMFEYLEPHALSSDEEPMTDEDEEEGEETDEGEEGDYDFVEDASTD